MVRRSDGRAAALWAVCATACYVGVDSRAEGDGEATGTGGGMPDDDADGGSEDGGDDGVGADACADAAVPDVALRYLTRLEYENTVRDLFGEPMDVTGSFAADEAAGGYHANATQAPSPTQLAMFVDTAKELARIAIDERLDHFVDCEPNETGCAEAFVRAFGRRAFRRPLADDEVASYLADADEIAADQGAAMGMQVVAAAMLASPHFLYVGDRSASAPELAAYDLAARLSYFLWATMPDDELLAAAERGELDTAAGVEAQARRMIDDPRASATLTSFSQQWLELDELAHTPKDLDAFPSWSDSLVAAAAEESGRLLEHVVRDGDGTLRELLVGRDAWVDAELAALYGVDAPAEGAGWVVLPENERAGLLTRAAFLARHSHASAVSWVHRGKVVRERLLCGELPPPPPVADDAPINDDSRLTDPTCSGCHTLMDPIGVGFDAYDPIGRFVGGDAPGEVVGLPNGEFDGAVDLSTSLADSPEVAACFARQLYRYANRRPDALEDACILEQLQGVFADSGTDIRDFVVALVTTATFRGGAR